MQSRFDVKTNLAIYLPVLFELLDSKELNWKTINKRLEIRLNEHKLKYERKGEPILVEASVFGVIVATVRGNEQAKSFLDFIRKLFEELVDHLDKNEKHLIKNNLFGLFTNIDLNYLNFLGELCVLNHIKRNTDYKLQATEFPLDSAKKKGSKIDFKFINPRNSKELSVEVMNIHLNEIALWSDEKLNNLVSQKIQEKLNLKGIKLKPTFFLVPVLWGGKEEIEAMIGFYDRTKPSFQNTTIPACFMAYRYESGPIVHKFGAIDGILK